MSNHLRFLVHSFAVTAALLASTAAYADGVAPSQREPRGRTCCALANHLPLHLGSAHVPLSLDSDAAPESIGPHSYSGEGPSHETNGIIYTNRGGFIDSGHTREYADVTARLLVQLRPMLRRGQGVIRARPRDGEVLLHVTGRVPDEELAETSVRLARRIAFEISVWVEITQYYGHAMVRGADEQFSAFTPEDLYSNLLGTTLGPAAVDSPLPYDRAMDVQLAEAFRSLGAMSSAETRRILRALTGKWWRASTPWPSPALPIVRAFDLGPLVSPMLPPPDVTPPAVPVVLEVPQVDARGAPLTDLYRLEILPDVRGLPRFTRAADFPVVTNEDLPRLVDEIRRAHDAEAAKPGASLTDGEGSSGPLAHYVNGLRLLELEATGGIVGAASDPAKGVFGASLLGLRGDTRGGDFAMLRFDVNHTVERGIISSFALFRSDAFYFCRDPEAHRTRPPLISILGPCARGEWLGIGGSIGEGFHDGRTGRTALRPIAAYGVLNALGNGQSPSYDGLRLLLRGGGAVEHVWTSVEGATTIPRAGGNVVLLARTPGRHLEVYGGAGYRLDPTTPRDAAFESNLSLRWYFLLGGNRAARFVDGVDPWGVGSLGLEGGYSYWTRPLHSYPDIAAPFVSAERSGTWQLLVTATLGFEGLTL